MIPTPTVSTYTITPTRLWSNFKKWGYLAYGKVAPHRLKGYLVSMETTGSDGILLCQVTDDHGSPPIATIVIADENGNSRLGDTDRNGTYDASLAPGKYELASR